MNPLFDIECAVAAGLITPDEIANAPIVFVDKDGKETEI